MQVELKAALLELIGECSADTYPLQKKKHSLEYLRSIAHLRPRTNTIGAVTRVRSALAFATHQFFRDAGFQYIHTPILSAADCEGAGEMFQVLFDLSLVLLNIATLIHLHIRHGNKSRLSCKGYSACSCDHLFPYRTIPVFLLYLFAWPCRAMGLQWLHIMVRSRAPADFCACCKQVHAAMQLQAMSLPNSSKSPHCLPMLLLVCQSKQLGPPTA